MLLLQCFREVYRSMTRQRRSDTRAGATVYILPPNQSVYLKFLCGCFVSLTQDKFDIVYIHPNQIPGYAPVPEAYPGLTLTLNSAPPPPAQLPSARKYPECKWQIHCMLIPHTVTRHESDESVLYVFPHYLNKI